MPTHLTDHTAAAPMAVAGSAPHVTVDKPTTGGRGDRNLELAWVMAAGRAAAARLDDDEGIGPMGRRELRNAVRAGEDARTALITENTDLVHYALRRSVDVARSSSWYDDLFQEGCCGLIRAADKFDPALGHQFSTYAMLFVRAFILRHHNTRIIALPRDLVRDRARMLGQLGQGVSFDDAAARVGIDTGRAVVAMTAPTVSSPASCGGDPGTGDDDVAVEIDFDLALDRETLPKVISAVLAHGVDDDERLFLVARYGLDGNEPQTLSEIAAAWGMNRHDLRGIELRAFSKLTHPRCRSMIGRLIGEVAE